MMSHHESNKNVGADGGNSARIEICGGIASGKTTLAALMPRAGYNAVFENFQSNPFIENFYSDPDFYGFETEVCFLLQHYSQIKTKALSSHITVCDYSLYLDLAYAHVTLSSSHLSTFSAVYSATMKDIGQPALLVHLRCGAKTEMERIRHRCRPMEQSISLEYLESINNSLGVYVEQARQQTKVIELDSEKLDFAHEAQVQAQVVKLVVASLPVGAI
jgi:deoxyadenosine/deoxycytidine kinase